MSTTTKYTSDGKKVIVVGKLNAQETIVQEIFVASSGQEIPSGENFIVKSLHDEPVKSWKEKQLESLEKTYEQDQKEWRTKIERQKIELRNSYEKARLKSMALFKFAENSKPEQMETLRAFLSGEITHFFVGGFAPSIKLWDEVYDNFNERHIDTIKLISLYGNSNGDLSYRIHRYSDGSGGSHVSIIPCRSYKEALHYAQSELAECAEKYIAGKISLNLDHWLKIEGIVIPCEVKSKYEAEKQSSRQERIDRLQRELDELKGGAK